MGTLLADLRYAVRMLTKHPGLSTISIVALALGIGLTTMMWSITYGGILRGLPFETPEDIIHLERARPSRDIESMGVPIHDFTEWRRAQKSFEDLSAWYEGTVNLAGAEARPERFEGAFISASAFRMIRVHPILGRTFTDDEDRKGAPAVVMLGYDLWRNRFAGDSGVVGKTVRANGTTAEIIGVMPRGFQFPTNASIWLPLRQDPGDVAWGQGSQFEVMGRLKPGVTMPMALQDITTIATRLAQDHPRENEGVTAILQPFTHEYIGDNVSVMLWTMMGAVFGVLLIACSNVANLLLARAAMRTKEVAVRTALGASRWRVVSQLLTESLVLSMVGAVLGLGIAWVGVRLFNNALASTDVPFWIKIGLDLPVMIFVVAVTVIAALVSGVVPALQSTRTDIQSVLKDESRGASSLRMGRFSRGLVVAELALSGGLLVAAGFMIQSVIQLSRFNYGVETRNVFTGRVGLFEAQYPDSTRRMNFWRNLERRLEEIPGHQGVALMTVLPGLFGWTQNFGLDGTSYNEERDYPVTRRVAVSASYFTAFKVAPLQGRVFTAADEAGSQPVAVVTIGWVNKFLNGADPIGKRFRLGGPDSPQPWLTVIGVVPEIWYDGTDEAPQRATVFTPIQQADYGFLSIAVITPTGSDPMAFAEPVRAAVNAIDADQPTYFVRSLPEALREDNWFYATFGALFAVFGAAALFLATVGVYGVMSFAVSRRTQEVGVRMALGAQGGDVLRMFMRQGSWQIGLGLVLGIGLAYALAQGLRFVMFQVNTNNWMMYAGVSLAMAVTALLAILIPSLRATKVNPLQALRYD